MTLNTGVKTTPIHYFTVLWSEVGGVSLLRVSQGSDLHIHCAGFLSRGNGEELVSNVIQVFGRIQFLVGVRSLLAISQGLLPVLRKYTK